MMRVQDRLALACVVPAAIILISFMFLKSKKKKLSVTNDCKETEVLHKENLINNNVEESEVNNTNFEFNLNNDTLSASNFGQSWVDDSTEQRWRLSNDSEIVKFVQGDSVGKITEIERNESDHDAVHLMESENTGEFNCGLIVSTDGNEGRPTAEVTVVTNPVEVSVPVITELKNVTLESQELIESENPEDFNHVIIVKADVTTVDSSEDRMLVALHDPMEVLVPLITELQNVSLENLENVTSAGIEKEADSDATVSIAKEQLSITLDKLSESRTESCQNLDKDEREDVKVTENLRVSESDDGDLGDRDLTSSPHCSNISEAPSEDSDSGTGSMRSSPTPLATLAAIVHARNLSVIPEVSSEVCENLIYQFEFPKNLSGLLIGKQGCNVAKIKEKSRATVFVFDHAEDQDLCVCEIEGRKEEIDSAYKMLKRRFPISKFPEFKFQPYGGTAALTYQNEKEIPIPLISQLRLPQAETCDVYLSNTISPGHFFLQQRTHPTFSTLLTQDMLMSDCYGGKDTPGVTEEPYGEGLLCILFYSETWCRVLITYINRETEECQVKLVDYGGYLTVPLSALRKIWSDFVSLPFQAEECYLANVVPVGVDWSEEARRYFDSLVLGHSLVAQVVSCNEMGTPFVNLFSKQENEEKYQFVNSLLVSHGFAQRI